MKHPFLRARPYVYWPEHRKWSPPKWLWFLTGLVLGWVLANSYWLYHMLVK